MTHTFAAHVSPFQVFGETLRLCSLTDITAAKSRESHEHIFFHDVLNTVSFESTPAGGTVFIVRLPRGAT